MKIYGNVELCLQIHPITLILLKNVSKSSGSSSGIFFYPSIVQLLTICCAVTPIRYAVTHQPLSMASYSTLDGELLHSGGGVTAQWMCQKKHSSTIS